MEGGATNQNQINSTSTGMTGGQIPRNQHTGIQPQQQQPPQQMQFNYLREKAYNEQTNQKGDRTYEKMVRYLDIQNANYDTLGELFEQNVVMAVGPTGVGKSTLMNAVIQGRQKMDMDEYARPIVLETLTYKGKPVFEIGHEARSCTASPGFYCHQNLYFVDCPGLFDQDRSKEYPNQTAVHLIQKNAKASIILVVFGSSQLTVTRGSVFAQQLTGILRQIGQHCDKEQLKKMILPIFVNYAASIMPRKLIKQIGTVIEAVDKKYKEKDSDYQDIFSGPTFPLEPEIPQFRMLCEVIQENFICLDPLDSSVRHFEKEKKELKIDQVVQLIQDRFDNKMYATPDNYNDDLPLQMYQTLEDEVFQKLQFSSTFYSSKNIRNESSAIFSHIFTPWFGEITDRAKASLKRQIEIADTAARDKIFSWYIKKVSPLLVKQAKKESTMHSEFRFREGQIDKFPILNLLRHISIKFDLINETDEDKFTFEVWREELQWFKANYSKMSDDFKKKNFGSKPTQNLNFGHAIQLLIVSTLENEQNDRMKEQWAKQSKEKFLLYFKTALPQLYEQRFRRGRVKFLLNVNNSAIKGWTIRAGQMILPRGSAPQNQDPPEEEKKIEAEPQRPKTQKEIKEEEKKKKQEQIKAEKAKKEFEKQEKIRLKNEEKAREKQRQKDGAAAKNQDKELQDKLREELKKAKINVKKEFKNHLAVRKFEMLMNLPPGTATVDQVKQTQAGLECYAKWIAPLGTWKDDMHDDLLSEAPASVLSPPAKQPQDSDARPPTTPVLQRRAYFEEVKEDDEVSASGHQPQNPSLIDGLPPNGWWNDKQSSEDGSDKTRDRSRLASIDNDLNSNHYGIDPKKYPVFAYKANSYGREIECPLKQPESLSCLHESIKWMEEKIDQLDLAEKDVVVVIGASRSGKGTLLTALKGKRIMFKPLTELFNEDEIDDDGSDGDDFGCSGMLMVCVDDQEEDSDSGIISHSSNSHTLAPSIAHGPEYITDFKQLQGHYLIDFAGMFDARGGEIEVAIDLALQMLIQRAKSTKLGLLVPVNHLLPDSKSIITRTQEKLGFMFNKPSLSVQVIVSKLKMYSEQYSREKILKLAQSDEDAVSYNGYEVCLAEADEQETLVAMLENFQSWPQAKDIAKRGWINPDRIKTLIDAEKTSSDNQHEFDIRLSHKIKNAIMKHAGNDRKPLLFGQLKQILKTGDLDQMRVITDEMSKLTDQEINFWNNIQDINKVKSILGLVPEYQDVNSLLELGFPAISKAIYGHEQEILTIVTQILIIGAEGLSQDIGNFTQECSNKKIFIEADQQKIIESIKDLKSKCDKICDQISFTEEDKELMREKMTAVAASLGSGAALAGCSYAYYVGALGLVVGWQIMLIPCALSLAVFITISLSKAKQQKKLQECSQILAKMVLDNIASLKLQIQVAHKRTNTLNTRIHELDGQINQLIMDKDDKVTNIRYPMKMDSQFRRDQGEYWDKQVDEGESMNFDSHLQRQGEEEKIQGGSPADLVMINRPNSASAATGSQHTRGQQLQGQNGNQDLTNSADEYNQNRTSGTSLLSKWFNIGRKSDARGLDQSQREGSERRDGKGQKKK